MPVEEFVSFRAAARRLGLGFEVHAGEMGPPSSIVESLDVLEADRIGHGVAAVRDRKVLERLVRDQVVLDVCPSSNVAVGLFPSLGDHPVAALWRAGANLTISSDDPPFMHSTLTDELRHVVPSAGSPGTTSPSSSAAPHVMRSPRKRGATSSSTRSRPGSRPASLSDSHRVAFAAVDVDPLEKVQ